jgi:basic amino acid/polyamine antiporter, APA family
VLSLFKVFNGNFVAASRLLFAMARRGLLNERLAFVHPRNQTPATATLATGIATGLCMFLGTAVLVPISEVGSVASAIGWFAVCSAFLRMQPKARDWLITVLGALVGLAMALMKFLPFVPGHFSAWEWLVLGLWIALGATIGHPRRAPIPRRDGSVDAMENS